MPYYNFCFLNLDSVGAGLLDLFGQCVLVLDVYMARLEVSLLFFGFWSGDREKLARGDSMRPSPKLAPITWIHGQ